MSEIKAIKEYIEKNASKVMEMINKEGKWETVEVFHRDGYNEYFWACGDVTREYPEEEI